MKIHHLIAAAICGSMPMLYSCGSDDLSAGLDPDAGDGVYASLSVAAKGVGSLPQSRWVPDKENAVNHEAEIQDVIVVIYQTSFNSTSLSDAEKPLQVVKASVTATGTTSAAGEPIYSIPKFRLSEQITAGDYYVFIIANPGTGVTADYFRDRTIKQIRDEVCTTPIYRDANGGDLSKFDRFVMTSDVERRFTLTDAIISSHGTADLSNDVDNSLDGPIRVERLAARIDVSFGPSVVYGTDNTVVSNGALYLNASNQMVTFNNGTPSAVVSTIELPVYDYTHYKADPTDLVLTYDRFVISDIDVRSVVNDKQLYVQKTSAGYFTDENWQHKVKQATTTPVEDHQWSGWYANGPVAQASGVHKTETEDHTLADLIQKRNNLYTNTDGVPYYTLGYYRENINNKATSSIADIQLEKTAVRITGTYKKASDLSSGASNVPTTLDFVIMHCSLDAGSTYPRIAGAMSYAIGRNTIYRLCIDKVLCDSEKVYVIWYYDSNNNGEYDTYVTPTPFGSDIVDKNTAPND